MNSNIKTYFCCTESILIIGISFLYSDKAIQNEQFILIKGKKKLMKINHFINLKSNKTNAAAHLLLKYKTK